MKAGAARSAWPEVARESIAEPQDVEHRGRPGIRRQLRSMQPKRPHRRVGIPESFGDPLLPEGIGPTPGERVLGVLIPRIAHDHSPNLVALKGP